MPTVGSTIPRQAGLGCIERWLSMNLGASQGMVFLFQFMLLSHGLSLREAGEETGRQKLKQSSQRNTAYLLASSDLLRYLSQAAQVHLRGWHRSR